MNLDLASSLISVGSLITVMGLWMLAASFAKEEPNAGELRVWAISCLFFGACYALIAARTIISVFWSVVIGNTIYAAAFGGFGFALARLLRRRFPIVVVSAGILLSSAALYITEIVYQTSAFRVLILAAVTFAPWVVSTVQCGRSWRQRPSAHIMAMTIAFFSMIVVSISRIVWGAVHGSFGYAGLPTGPGFMLGSYVLVISPALLTVGFFLLSAERTQRIFRELADTDPLTGILNRRSTILLADNRLASARRRKQPFSCVAFDLDDLKVLNDTYGHVAGDRALLHLAKIVGEQVRAEDIFGRIGGDEFVVFMPYSDQAGAIASAERFRTALEANPVTSGGEHLVVTGSFGVVTLAPSDESALDLLGRADQAVYDAKKTGGNAVVGRGAFQKRTHKPHPAGS